MIDLISHRIELALVRPQIAPNVGNVGRTCVASGARLHLVRPLGFILDDRNLRRAGLDYWPRLNLSLHDDLDSFLNVMRDRSLWFFDSTGSINLFDVPFADSDVLVLGSETRGIDPAILQQHAHRVVRIPQAPGERCLNLATSAGIALYAALNTATRRARYADQGEEHDPT